MAYGNQCQHQAAIKAGAAARSYQHLSSRKREKKWRRHRNIGGEAWQLIK